MGLGATLYARSHIFTVDEATFEHHLDMEPYQLLSAKGIEHKPRWALSEIATWSGHQAVHDWIDQRIGGFPENAWLVSIEAHDLEDLKETCQKVLLVPGMAGTEFPDTVGGRDEESFLAQLTEIVKDLEKVDKIQEAKGNWEFCYQASW